MEDHVAILTGESRAFNKYLWQCKNLVETGKGLK